MSERQHRDLDPMLADLLEGRRSSSDADVRALFASQPALERQYRELAALKRKLGDAAARANSAVADAERGSPDASEDRILAGFRAHVAARQVVQRRKPWGWLAAAAAAVILSLVWWSAARDTHSNDGYLDGNRAIFAMEPNTPFGTLHWNRLDRAVTFDLRVWTSRSAATEQSAPAWTERGLGVLSWTLPADQLPAEIRELVWELRQLDAGGTELARGSFAQQR